MRGPCRGAEVFVGGSWLGGHIHATSAADKGRPLIGHTGARCKTAPTRGRRDAPLPQLRASRITTTRCSPSPHCATPILPRPLCLASAAPAPPSRCAPLHPLASEHGLLRCDPDRDGCVQPRPPQEQARARLRCAPRQLLRAEARLQAGLHRHEPQHLVRQPDRHRQVVRQGDLRGQHVVDHHVEHRRFAGVGPLRVPALPEGQCVEAGIARAERRDPLRGRRQQGPGGRWHAQDQRPCWFHPG